MPLCIVSCKRVVLYFQYRTGSYIANIQEILRHGLFLLFDALLYTKSKLTVLLYYRSKVFPISNAVLPVLLPRFTVLPNKKNNEFSCWSIFVLFFAAESNRYGYFFTSSWLIHIPFIPIAACLLYLSIPRCKTFEWWQSIETGTERMAIF